mgnify:CR=1 FL=1
MLRHVFSHFKAKKPTPLGRWGVSPEKVLTIYGTSPNYDHSLDTKGVQEFCEFHIKDYITYCGKCHSLVQPDKLEHVNEKFGYLHKNKCRIHSSKMNIL